jgi:hypothetical protein
MLFENKGFSFTMGFLIGQVEPMAIILKPTRIVNVTFIFSHKGNNGG